jgi:hypothetical protein
MEGATKFVKRSLIGFWEAALAFSLLATFVAPVWAASHVPGVSVGDYVKLGNWYSIGVVPEHVVKWEKIDVIAVSSEEITWRTTGEMNMSSVPFPDNNNIYNVNVQSGETNYTHSTLGFIIAANLNEGDQISDNPISLEISKTEIRSYLNVSRSVNVILSEETGVGVGGNYTIKGTFVYDKTSGMLMETENRIWWSNVTNPDHLVYMSVNETNIFSASPQADRFPVEIIYPVGAAVVIAPIGVAAVMLRKRKQAKAKPKTMEPEKIDFIFNSGGVNRGECYLTDSLESCVKIVCEIHSHGVSALAIVREDPEFLTKTCNVNPDNVILLSSKPIKGFKAISTLQEVSIAIMRFVKANGGVVLLDGLEYLISRFGFNAVYMMLQEKKIEFLETGAVLLVPVNMETLDSREKGQLLSELKLL